MANNSINDPRLLSKSMWMFLLVATIVITVITLALMLKKQPAIDQAVLETEIESIQKKLPIRIDAYTELSNVEAGPLKITYYLTAITRLAKDNNQAFAKQAETAVKTNACVNKKIKHYIDSNVSLSYHYLSKDQATIAEFKIPAGFCNAK